jgi:hypothetical protein
MSKLAKPDLAKSTSKALADYAKKANTSPVAAQEALVRLGTHTKTGRVAKAYK